MAQRMAFMVVGLLNCTSADPAQAQFFTFDCSKPDLTEIIKSNPGIPRATIESTIKEACKDAKANASPPAPPVERTIDWPAANCVPADQIEVKLRTIGFPPPFSDLAARIRESCSKVPQTRAPDPATSHVGPVHDAQFLPDGSFVSAGHDRTLRQWRVAPPAAAPRVIYTALDKLWSVRPSPDGRLAAVSSSSEPIKIIDLQSGKVTMTLETSDKEMRTMSWMPDGRRILATASESEIGLFDATTGKPIRKYPAFKYGTSNVAVSTNGQVAAAVGGGSEIVLWLVDTGQKVMEGRLQGNGATALAFEPNGNRLVIGLLGRFDVYDTKAGKFLKPLTLTVRQRQRGVGAAFLPERDRVLTCGATMHVWDIADARDLGERARFPFQCSSLALSSDGVQALITHDDSDIRLIDVKTGAITATFGQPKIPDLKIALPN
jgi:WD40 repeat protein